MQLFAVVTLLFSASALAAPPSDLASQGNVCPKPGFNNPQCCSTDVVGIVDLDCRVPSGPPKNAKDFEEVCVSTDQRARCCFLPVLEQDVLCE
ncbi:hydrophobin, partial [Mycena capillaripes]